MPIEAATKMFFVNSVLIMVSGEVTTMAGMFGRALEITTQRTKEENQHGNHFPGAWLKMKIFGFEVGAGAGDFISHWLLVVTPAPLFARKSHNREMKQLILAKLY